MRAQPYFVPPILTPTLDTGQASDRRREISGLIFLNEVPFRQHPLMQDTGNEDASRFTPEKHDVLALFHAAQPRAYGFARTAGL